MASLCVVQPYPLSKVRQMTDTELRDLLSEAIADDPLRAIHLCYELLDAERNRGMNRHGLRTIVRQSLKVLSQVA
ncbi:MAG: hypothetical protein R3180_00090 [Marinobacter sp.]|nr:hypothetical protein [Marinobacter sp.]